ncbi:porin [Labrenzia sp. VG12]|uniref:porin n=1 Tax=Labrenzia sp. VG12 TaxID=2021862 RepID=UPI000B8BDC21|nr:porin [Labrenzia sp. VG12]ASP32164.1 porin [Labrenzia sp. VG12]
MKLKSLMLGAAAVATATTAQAADLPVAPEPVDYVRVCDAYGARFYYIPGTETCLRVGGRVRTQFVVNNVLEDGNWSARDSDGYSWLARGYLYLDARTATEFGTLRAYVSIYASNQNGVNSTTLDNAYIQWGGLTAGRLGSNFDIFTGQVFMGVVTRDWSDSTLNQLAYTAAFGNGLSATIALEDRSGRESGTYGGTRMPDVVAALGISQGWGSAQISGALHQVYPSAAFNGINPGNGEDELGWAIGAGASINLPFANSGSNIFFQGFYADGALSYTGNAAGVTDFVISANSGNATTNSGYSLSAGAYIQATSTIGLALDGSYAAYDNAGTAGDVTRWAIDGSVQWEPVSGFVMGADVGYADTDWDNTTDTEELLFGVRLQRTF